MAETRVGRAILVAAPAITLMIVTLFAFAFLISTILGLPSSLALPALVRVVGAAVILAGLAVMGWLFKYRGPANVIVSTYVTYTKLFRRIPLAESSGRAEQLVVEGPQKYVRHPLYFGVVVMVFGWALLGAYTFVFIATVVVFIWFRFFIIPFEEKELYALFGEQYRIYSDETPMIIPFTRRRRFAD